ncbi:hypothetical protein WJX82_010123 [Trebouxia sp. C0006]
MVNVDRCDSYKLCIGEAFQHDLEPIYRETTVDHWMTLDGSKSGFADDEVGNFDAIDERIVQVEEHFDTDSPDKIVNHLDGPSLAARIVGRMCKRWWQGLDCASMSALLSLRDLVDWQKISACVTAMARVTEQQQDRSYSLVLQGFEALFLFQGGVQNMWPGKAFTRCLAAPGGLQHTGLQDAYSDLIHMFIQQQEAFPLEQVLAPACAQMASPQDHAKLARSPTLLKLMVHCMTELQQLTAHVPGWSLSNSCPARWCKGQQLCQDLYAFLHHPDSCVYQALTDSRGWRHVQGWVTRRHDKVQCEVEQSGAVHLVTCIKTERWQDMLIQRYNRRCAWLQAITGAVKEVTLLLVLRQSLARPQRS